MSEILNLAQNLEKKSKQQVANTELLLKTEFKKHEQRIQAALNESVKNIESDLSAQSKRLSRIALKTWFYIPLTIITIMLIAWGVAWGQGKLIEKNWQTISEQNQTIKILEDQGGKIKFNSCEGRKCVQIDETAPTYQGGYMILRGY